MMAFLTRWVDQSAVASWGKLALDAGHFLYSEGEARDHIAGVERHYRSDKVAGLLRYQLFQEPHAVPEY